MVKWFKFKKKKEKQSSENNEEGYFGNLKQIDKTIYNVGVVEGLGSVPREIKKFQTNRYRDPEDDLIYLASKKIDFFGLFPSSKDQVINFTERDCKTKIAHYRKKLKDLTNKKQPDSDNKITNIKSIELQIKKWEAKARYFKYNHKDSSFLYFDQQNIPSFMFNRVGSDMIPIAWDLSTQHLFIMSDTRKKTLKISRDRKDKKYGQADNIFKTIGFGVLVIAFLLFLLSVYTYNKSNDLYSENEFNKLKAENIALQQECSQVTIDTAKEMTQAAKELKNQLKPTQEVKIEGIVPK